ncbi:MAG: hypothetical protein EOO38_03550 [Cytophagaceae bacterium]|nr:MAG: hypothetical protein EOO38_03550 [Cytophagaceae bacterium]
MADQDDERLARILAKASLNKQKTQDDKNRQEIAQRARAKKQADDAREWASFVELVKSQCSELNEVIRQHDLRLNPESSEKAISVTVIYANARSDAAVKMSLLETGLVQVKFLKRDSDGIVEIDVKGTPKTMVRGVLLDLLEYHVE